MSATDTPPLQVDGLFIEAHNMPVIVVWGNLEASRFFTLAAANAALTAEYYVNGRVRSHDARIFGWDGKVWSQITI